jgi:hypothetical protein
MEEVGFDEEVYRFLVDQIDTVPQMEALLLADTPDGCTLRIAYERVRVVRHRSERRRPCSWLYGIARRGMRRHNETSRWAQRAPFKTAPGGHHGRWNCAGTDWASLRRLLDTICVRGAASRSRRKRDRRRNPMDVRRGRRALDRNLDAGIPMQSALRIR